MMGLGWQELVIVLIIIMIIFGAGKLPAVARSFHSPPACTAAGRSVREGYPRPPPPPTTSRAAPRPRGRSVGVEQGERAFAFEDAEE